MGPLDHSLRTKICLQNQAAADSTVCCALTLTRDGTCLLLQCVLFVCFRAIFSVWRSRFIELQGLKAMDGQAKEFHMQSLIIKVGLECSHAVELFQQSTSRVIAVCLYGSRKNKEHGACGLLHYLSLVIFPLTGDSK